MGNNAAFTDFETIVIGLYDLHKLDLTTLDLVGYALFGYPDIDPGGGQDLVTFDGKPVEQVVVELLDPTFKPDKDSDDIHSVGLWDAFWELAEERWQHAPNN